jgi:threonine/homoserine/homoserine lactone efflux protein
MLSHVLIGATFAFSAAVQPGPFQAYLVSSAMTNGWRRTLPAVFAPILSDVPIVCVVLLVLTNASRAWLEALRIAGGLFLLYLSARAFVAFRDYRHDRIARTEGGLPGREAGAPGAASIWRSRTLFEAVAVNLLNPNPYISWSTVLGPLALRAWREAPSSGVAFVGAFYATMIVATALLVLLLSGARSLGPRIGRAFVGLSATALAAFACYQLWTGIVGIRS